jgi:acylphosphatase
VGYRYSCVAEAAKHPIVGWVRNLPDGRVEAVFEGPPAAVAAMVEWCQKGPRYSHVTDVAVVTEQAEGFTRFSVRG